MRVTTGTVTGENYGNVGLFVGAPPPPPSRTNADQNHDDDDDGASAEYQNVSLVAF